MHVTVQWMACGLLGNLCGTPGVLQASCRVHVLATAGGPVSPKGTGRTREWALDAWMLSVSVYRMLLWNLLRLVAD
jgi:hypothetical protein